MIYQTKQSFGFDVSVWSGQIDCFSCIRGQGYNLMIIEIYSSAKQFNKYLVENIFGAQKANLLVDVYIFPDIDRDPVEQIDFFLGFLKNNSVSYGRVWIDIENTALWFKDCQKNIQFLKQLIESSQKYVELGRIGIYSSNSQWQPIMCGNQEFLSFQLWWPRYDNVTSIDNFTSFGGWQNPVMKQYFNEVKICCANTDVNWIPDIMETK